MPIGGLYQLLTQKKLIHQEPLSKLKDTTLCVDGHHWLKGLNNIDEPWHMAMGGLPLGLTAAVDEELQKFKKANIKPFFVFNGINPSQQHVENKTPGWVHAQGVAQYRKREEAWDLYAKGQIEAAKTAFATAGSSLTSADFLTALLSYLRSEHVSFFRAPYLAWAQMAWFVSQRGAIADCVYGSEETLLFLGMVQVERLITRIDWEARTFEWVSLKEILNSLGSLTHSQFVDCCIMAGFRSGQMRGIQYTPDEIDHSQPYTPGKQLMKQFEKIEDTAQQMSTFHPQSGCWGYDLLDTALKRLQSSQEYIASIQEQFMRIKNLIHHHVIIDDQGHPKPISEHNWRDHIVQNTPFPYPLNMQQPNNLDQVLGPKLPEMVYFLLCGGCINNQVVNNVVHNLMTEYRPVIDSAEYRELLRKIVPLRTQIAFLLSNCLAKADDQYWKAKTLGGTGNRVAMNCVQWYMETFYPLNTPPELYLDDWNLSQADTNTSEQVNFKTVMAYNRLAWKSVPSFPHNKTYSSLNEVMSAILLKTLDLLGYFTHPQQQQPIGPEESGMSLFAEALDNSMEWQFAEPGVLFIELIRTGALSAAPITPPEPPAVVPTATISTQPGADPDTLLITRTVSLLSARVKATEWQSNKVVRDLCAFHVMVKSLHKTLRNLSEVILTTMLLENRIKLKGDPNEPLLETLTEQIFRRLPFATHLNIVLGIVLHYILTERHPDSQWAKNNVQNKNPKEAWSILGLEKVFPSCTHLRADLQQGCEFWREASKIVEKLAAAQAIPGDLQSGFKQATTLLRRTATLYGFWDQK
eukprot:TRINITY_DN66608_c10_g1_i2.p1 TRINITY_DN66608_c10_g1~~TRINITY_DN66608_c10_g1_i2.p1  ORF type:complete len:825 (-),score=29.71 TRINITY_DN66608_c10_g1_i2:68-2485(-)